MGKRNSQKKSASMMLDSEDDESMSSTSTRSADLMSISANIDVEVERDHLLDQALDALYEKRGTTREKALSAIIDAFNTNLQYDFVEKKFATLLHQCLNSIKKGSSKEISLAAHVIGLLALTVGSGDHAHEIFEQSIVSVSQALKSAPGSPKIASLVECLAIVTFIGGNETEEIDQSMQIMWQVIHPKLGPNVVAVKPSADVIASVVSAWSFLLTSLDRRSFNHKAWLESLSYLSTLLDKDDRAVRIAAGEAVAVILEVGSFEKFAADLKAAGVGGHGTIHDINGIKEKIHKQVKDLSVEAGGKGSAKKDLNNQRNLFRDILVFIEDGYSPETSMKIGGDLMATSTWSQLIQLNFLKHFLGGGFVKHMQDNSFLQDVLGFTPKKSLASELNRSSIEKKWYKSPNSAVSKARTQHLNKQRLISQGKNTGHFAVDAEFE
uniref:Interferon-related developmental regulator 1 n=1 Tax=Kalanchoe fedtschenkoi TaxID=63787 RepID=A0A7N0UAI8_KALFE